MTGRGGAGWVESQQVVEVEGIYKCEWGWDHYCVLSCCLLFLSLFSSGFQDLLRLNPPSLLMLFGCISISMASLLEPRRRELPKRKHITY